MAASLKAAIIGLGVGERHIVGYESDPRCEVVALCDIDEERLQAVGSRHPGKRLTSDPAQVLHDPDIDVVSVASYDDAHYSQSMAALANGKHVFVEKPLCLHDDEFEAIDLALEQRPELRLSSNFVLRRAPQFMELRARVRSGALGRLYFIAGDYNYGRVHKITDGWRGALPFYSVTHGGAIHLVDLMLWLSGGRIVDVVAVGNQIATAGTGFRFPDMVSALLRFEDGMTAKVAANFGCVCPHHHSVQVFGTDGTFMYGAQGGVFYGSRDPQVPPEQIHLQYAATEKVSVQRSFVASILDGSPSDVSEEEVLSAMAVSLAIERSLRSGQWETVRHPRSRRRARDAA
jgi:predicted dehydrogenase